MKNYCTGTLEQVRNCSNGDYPTLQEMLDLRRQSSGVSPLFALVEYVSVRCQLWAWLTSTGN